MATQRYVVVEGIHYDRTANPIQTDPKDPRAPQKMGLFKKGDIIESETDLIAEFPNKFRKVLEDKLVIVTEARRLAVSDLIDRRFWPEEDREFLETLSGTAFDKVWKNSTKVDEQPTSPEIKKAASRLGEDVTDSFGRAYDEGLKVWRNPAGKHQVTKKGKPNNPINSEPLESDQVEAFVIEYLETSK